MKNNDLLNKELKEKLAEAARLIRDNFGKANVIGIVDRKTGECEWIVRDEEE